MLKSQLEPDVLELGSLPISFFFRFSILFFFLPMLLRKPNTMSSFRSSGFHLYLHPRTELPLSTKISQSETSRITQGFLFRVSLSRQLYTSYTHTHTHVCMYYYSLIPFTTLPRFCFRTGSVLSLHVISTKKTKKTVAVAGKVYI